MPRSFTESERAYINDRLLEAAQSCLAQYGIRKTTVDELTRRANIPKGTFYLFYDTKELLFFEVFCRFHDEMHERLLREIREMRQDISAEKLTELILGLCKALNDSFMLRFMTNGEMELLIRRLPPELAASHARQDNFSVEKLLALVPEIKQTDVKVLSAALRVIFMSMLHKHEIGEEVFDDALRILIRGVVNQMFEEDAL